MATFYIQILSPKNVSSGYGDNSHHLILSINKMTDIAIFAPHRRAKLRDLDIPSVRPLVLACSDSSIILSFPSHVVYEVELNYVHWVPVKTKNI